MKIKLKQNKIEQQLLVVNHGEIDVNNRITAAEKLHHAFKRGFINKSEVTKNTRVMIFKVRCVSSLIYSS